MRTCADCNHELNDLTQPCPSCGGTRQTVHGHATATLGPLLGSVSGIEVTYGPDRTWPGRWNELRERLSSLETAFEPNRYRGNQVLKQVVEGFFIDCFHMGDWLWEGSSAPLSEAYVRKFIENDPALRICDGIANTSKHKDRRKAVAITAVIRSVAYNADIVSVSIEWHNSSQSGSADALHLARQCVAAWRNFLAANNLHS